MIALMIGDALTVVGGDDRAVFHLYTGRISTIRPLRGGVGDLYVGVEQHPGRIPGDAFVVADARADAQIPLFRTP